MSEPQEQPTVEEQLKELVEQARSLDKVKSDARRERRNTIKLQLDPILDKISIFEMVKLLKPKPRFKFHWRSDRNPMSRNKKRRHCGAPNASMTILQLAFARTLERCQFEMPSARGCRKGDSIVTTVLQHRSMVRNKPVFNRHMVLVDIANAFRVTRLVTLAQILSDEFPGQFPSTNATAEFLGRYCQDSEFGGIVIGSQTSQDLFNIYCEVEIDRKLRELCETYGITYTRYLDDLIFSSQQKIGRGLRRRINAIIEVTSMGIKHSKAKVIDLKKGPRVVNGVGITYDGRLFLPGHTMKRLNGMLYTALRKGPSALSTSEKDGMAQIEGLMGRFKEILRPNRFMTKAEKRVWGMYQALKHREKRGG
jgi:hypothetical protein